MTAAPHPLSPLSAAEIDAFRAAAEAAGLVDPATRFAYVALEEPSRVDYRAFEPGQLRARLSTNISESTSFGRSKPPMRPSL